MLLRLRAWLADDQAAPSRLRAWLTDDRNALHVIGMCMSYLLFA